MSLLKQFSSQLWIVRYKQQNMNRDDYLNYMQLHFAATPNAIVPRHKTYALNYSDVTLK